MFILDYWIWLKKDWKKTGTVLWFYRGPVFASIVVALLIGTADQFREIFLWNTELFLEVQNSQDWVFHPNTIQLFHIALMPTFFVFSMRLLVDWQHQTVLRAYEKSQSAMEVDEPAHAKQLSAQTSPPPAPTGVLNLVTTLPLFATLLQIYQIFQSTQSHREATAAESFLPAFLQLGASEHVPSDYRVELGVVLATVVVFTFIACYKPYYFASNKRKSGKLSRENQSNDTRNIKAIVFAVLGVAVLTAAVIYPTFGIVVASAYVAFLYLVLHPSYVLFASPFLLFLLFLAVVYAIVAPIGFSEIGAIPVLTVFSIMLATLLTFGTWLEERFGIPATISVLILVVVFTVADLNDNHEVRVAPADIAGIPTAATGNENDTELQNAFRTWLSARNDYQQNSPKPYKVYLAAAQGGGLYAAYHSASAMARLQDLNPQFGQRLFAISGVSGGAVGGAVFAGLLQDLDHNKALPDFCDDRLVKEVRAGVDAKTVRYRNAVNCILRRDFLSPAGSALLFRDFFPRFLPFAIPAADRARVMEDAFIDHYTRATGTSDNLLTSSVFDWSPSGETPLLLLNVTDVSIGTRVVFSSPIFHFAKNNEDAPDAIENNDSVGARDPMVSYRQIINCQPGSTQCQAPTVATAMLLSARFPIVSPAGFVSLPECGKSTHPAYCNDGFGSSTKARFVDGGYFENSGLDAIAELIDGLQGTADEMNVEFEVVVFDFPRASAVTRSYGFGGALSPVRALNNSRSARILPARERVEKSGVVVRSVSLDNRGTGFTLGWLLSKQTFDRIDNDIYSNQTCENVQAIEDQVSRDRIDAFQIRLSNCSVIADINRGFDFAPSHRSISDF